MSLDLNQGLRESLLLLVGLAVLTGAWLRFHQLDHMVVWHDEVYTVARVFGFLHEEVYHGVHTGRIMPAAELLRFQSPVEGRGLAATLRALTEHPEHGPLYYLLARLAAYVVDEPLMAIRGTSALLSLLLLPAIFWLARELFGRGPADYVAVALVALSPLHILYAQEARQYALWMALTAAASAAFLYALRRCWGWTLYGVLLCLGLYTHLLFTELILIHGGFLYLRWRGEPRTLLREARPWVLAVGAALLAFSPWIGVLVREYDSFQRFTAWMSREVGLAELVPAWGLHLIRVFLDMPQAESFWPLGLLVLGGAFLLLRCAAPTLARVFLFLLLLLPLAIVVLPDLVLGGRRSLEARYLFPVFLGLELVVASVLARGLEAEGRGWRFAAIAALGLILTGGFASSLTMARANAWWSKSFSAENIDFAKVVNAAERPLLLGCPGDVSAGELISLSYRLDSKVRLLAKGEGEIALPEGYTALFVLLPCGNLRQQLKANYRLEPFQDSWKWFLALPKNEAAPAAE